MRSTILILSFFLVVNFLQGQEKVCHKIAHFDVEYIMSEWSKVVSVDSTIYSERNKLEAEFRPTYNDYLQLQEELNAGKYEGIVLEDKQLQYQQLKARVESFSTSLRTSLIETQQELMRPLLAELKATISEVADEGQYDYVISTTTGESSVVLFFRNQEDEITLEVLKRLSK